MALMRSQPSPIAGFSLIESVVAMSLFLSVVLLLSGILGRSFITADASPRSRAIQIAYQELHNAESALGPGSTQTQHDGGYLAQLEFHRNDRIGALTVTVTRHGRPLCTLHRILRLYQ